MQRITGRYDPAVGPPVDVVVVNEPGGQPEEPAVFTALVDTGATHTCVSSKVIAACGLPALGSTLMRSATGIERVNYYAFGIGILGGSEGDASREAQIQPIVFGPEFDPSGGPYDILLGRDVICLGEFLISRNGTFELAF